MSQEALWDRVRMAWAMLAGREEHQVQAGRERESPLQPQGDEPELSKDGYTDEALPWLDAVFRFALRLTAGDWAAAEDLTQETFLRAYRFWHRFERGTNAKSWLFTICRNAYLHQKERAQIQRERPAADLDTRVEAIVAISAVEEPPADPERDFFHRLIDDEVVAAIDGLPEEFREVLILSDLGDLRHAEIALVLGIPVGTAKSRLFRARRMLQERLRDFAVQSGYARENTR